MCNIDIELYFKKDLTFFGREGESNRNGKVKESMFDGRNVMRYIYILMCRVLRKELVHLVNVFLRTLSLVDNAIYPMESTLVQKYLSSIYFVPDIILGPRNA